MSPSANHNPWLHRLAVVTALATLGLIVIGGLVTSNGAGLAVPDWPTSYGYNMFALPIHFWRGGIFYEHTHRLWATVVGVLVVALTRWLGGRPSRLPLALIGLCEVGLGVGIFCLRPDLKGAGHFLVGIGGVVLLAALVWVRNAPARPLVALGWLAFGLVQLQGLLGGLRVVLLKDEIGIVHAALAQIFFVLLCVIALFTSRWWQEFSTRPVTQEISRRNARNSGLLIAVTALIFMQLLLGACMRHQHAGLAIPDFPLAYGKWWPSTDLDSVALYNQRRMESTAVNPITAFQIELQMVHRLVAVLLLLGVGWCAWRARRIGSEDAAGRLLRRLTWIWMGLILVQAGLGAATVLSRKAADIATAHVLVGALSLATGAALCIISRRSLEIARAGMISAHQGSAEAVSGTLPARSAAT